MSLILPSLFSELEGPALDNMVGASSTTPATTSRSPVPDW